MRRESFGYMADNPKLTTPGSNVDFPNHQSVHRGEGAISGHRRTPFAIASRLLRDTQQCFGERFARDERRLVQCRLSLRDPCGNLAVLEQRVRLPVDRRGQHPRSVVGGPLRRARRPGFEIRGTESCLFRS